MHVEAAIRFLRFGKKAPRHHKRSRAPLFRSIRATRSIDIEHWHHRVHRATRTLCCTPDFSRAACFFFLLLFFFLSRNRRLSIAADVKTMRRTTRRSRDYYTKRDRWLRKRTFADVHPITMSISSSIKCATFRANGTFRASRSADEEISRGSWSYLDPPMNYGALV